MTDRNKNSVAQALMYMVQISEKKRNNGKIIPLSFLVSGSLFSNIFMYLVFKTQMLNLNNNKKKEPTPPQKKMVTMLYTRMFCNLFLKSFSL